MFDLTYNGKTFNQRESDGYVNVGQLCATHDKQFQDWRRTQQSKAYRQALSDSTGITLLDLVVTSQGNEGSWAHPLVAIEVARWISPAFGVWCNMHIKQLIESGSTFISQPKELSRREILQLALEAEDRVLVLQAQIEADEPATTLGKAIAKAPNNIRIGDFAKSIGMGQNRYFDELREDGIIQQTSTLPYQRFLDAKYFVVTQVISGNGKTYPVALITPKGQAYLVKRHRKFISQETVRDAIECQVVALV
jgi:phage antirepressor YoqD-like protein